MTYMTKEEIWAAALRQSAVDLNCSPEDFGREHSVVVRSAPHAGARKYLSLPFFCDLVSYGGNVVASVAPEAEAAVRAYVERYAPDHCFETPNMNVLADALRPFGMRICFMAEYFLPDVSRMRQWDCGYALKVLGLRTSRACTGRNGATLCAKNGGNWTCWPWARTTAQGWWAWPAVRRIVKACGRSAWTCCPDTAAGALQPR